MQNIRMTSAGSVIDNPMYQNTSPGQSPGQPQMAHQNTSPNAAPTQPNVPGPQHATYADLQAHIANLDASYQHEDATLIAQFETQRRLLANEHASKMQRELLLIQKQQEAIMIQKKKEEQHLAMQAEQQRILEAQRLEMMNKPETISSTDIKLKLRDVLIRKTVEKDTSSGSSTPNKWSTTQHLSLDQQNPPVPMSGNRVNSPPLQRPPGMISKFEEAYPLRKAASEPNLKMRLALKQKMMERRCGAGSTLQRQQNHRRSGVRPRLLSNLSVDTTLSNSPESSPSSPHSQITGEIKEQSDPTTLTPFPLQLMSKMVNNQSMPNMAIGPMSGMPHPALENPIKCESPVQSDHNEAEIRARAAAKHGQPLTQHMLTGKLPMYPSLMELDPQAFQSAVYEAALVAATTGAPPLDQESIMRAMATNNTIPIFPSPPGNATQHSPPIITDSQAAHARLNRRPLNRTNSAPLPLPGQLPFNQQLQQMNKESQSQYLKQRLQATIIQKSQSKALMEQVNESASREALEGKEDSRGSFKARRRRRHEDDGAIYAVNEKSASQSNLSLASQTASSSSSASQGSASHSHEAFLRKLSEQASVCTPPSSSSASSTSPASLLQQRHHTHGHPPPHHHSHHHPHHAHRPRTSAHFDRACPLERTMSSPLVNGACRVGIPPPSSTAAAVPPSSGPQHPGLHSSPVSTSVSPQLSDSSRTGLAYDPIMLRHQCMCGDDRIHPENPTRVKAVYERLQETGLVDKCCRLRCKKASMEELQTCHSEAYTLMYGTSPEKFSAKLFEVLSPRFCKLACTGIGVDADTVWNNDWTPTSTRIAVGCIIELAINVAQGKLQNGLALVRPPGHHAEPTVPMGFCYFNGVAIAAKVLLDRYKLKRLLIIDWDVHHGNSTQQIFYADPRVLLISMHRHDNGNFFPGTGQPSDIGIDKGCGFNVNIGFSGKLNPPMGDTEYIAAFRTIVMPIAREFEPEIVLISAGFDAAIGHSAPLGGYTVSPACFGHMTKQVMTLAEGRVALALEGGYDLNSICDSTEMCLRALLGEEIPLLDSNQICKAPNDVAVKDIKLTMSYHFKYWNSLNLTKETIEYSLREAQQREREELETVKAFASLSVLPNSISNIVPMDEQ